MKKKIIIGYYNIPNFVTALSILLGILACYFVLRNEVAIGMLCMLYTGIVDGLDGFVARKLNANKDDNTKAFGAELDSATDIVNYTIAPVFVGYVLGFNTIIDIFIFWIYVVMATQRLSHYNLFGVPKKNGIIYYIGIPTTYASVTLCFVFAMYFIFGLPDLFVRLGYLITAFLFVLNVEVRDIRTIKFVVPYIHPLILTLMWIYLYFQGI